MKKYLCAIALTFSINAFAADNASIVGSYECKGHEVDTHAAYTCEMTIQKTGRTYASTATCSDGTSYRGTGIYDKKSHQLSTVFINPKNVDETGMSVAKIKPSGELAGAWTYLDKTSIAYASCYKMKEGPKSKT
jgi:hypothetical protein